MLSFKGEMSEDIIGSVVNLIENKLDTTEESPKLKRKVVNVLVECLQNLFHHNAKGVDDKGKKAVVLMLAKNVTGYSIITGNLIEEQKIENFKEKLDEINRLDKKELRSLYKKTLSTTELSELGGAGLGLIDIGRKSGEKLEYGFIPFDDSHAFFSLNVKISS